MSGSAIPFGVATFLAEPGRTAQVSAVSPSGAPLLGSLWFLYDEQRFWFSSRVHSPLVQAMRAGSEVAVIVDQFEPPDLIRQVRVRGPGRLEGHDPDQVESLYRRYLGDDTDAWPGRFRTRLTDTDFALWSVQPSNGLVAAFPNFDPHEIRWNRSEHVPLP